MARILLIDDDQDIRKIAGQVLGLAGHQVSTAPDATSGIDLLKQGEFDLLISDANMPGYSGFDLVKVVRALKRFEKLPIALLTARRERHDVELAMGLGVNDYIVKPLDPLLLVSKVDFLLSKKNESANANSPTPAHATSARLDITAKVHMDVHLLTVSENGLSILTKSPLKENDTLQLEASIFREMGIVLPPLLVEKTEFLNDTVGFQVDLRFKVINDRLLHKIRAWIIKKDPLQRSVKKAS